MASKGAERERPDDIDHMLADWARERPELDVSAVGVFGRISRLHAGQRAILNVIFERYDLTFASFDLLANLRRSGPPHRKTAGELATSSMLTTGGITFRLDKMEEQGLVERVRTSEDRRVVYAQLTPPGYEVIDAVFGTHVVTERQMLADLSDAEVKQLATLLKKAARSVERYAHSDADEAAS
jgi:DNA-binding MarR family transcriptional regulator